MKTIDDYKNIGFHAIGQDPASWSSKPRTVLVLGVARSGTSIVSGALHHLGVFTGDYSKDPVYEDVRLSNAIKSNDWNSVEEVIRDYDSKYSLWAYKRPNIIQATQRMGYLGRLIKSIPFLVTRSNTLALSNFCKFASRLRNPIFIVVFKDLFAIGNRNRISMNFEILDYMDAAWRQYGWLLAFIRRPDFSGLCISADRAVSDKAEFLDTLVWFCGLTPTDSQRKAALTFITENPTEYLDTSRVTKSIGYLDEVTPDFIRGWARYLGNERTTTVALFIDGREVARTEANIFRQDLLDTERHSEGKCAFRFEDFDPSLLKPGSEVRVRATEDINDLGNSPHYYSSES